MCTKNADRLKLVVVNSFRAGVFSRREIKEIWQRVYPEFPFDNQVMADYCVNMKSGKGTFPEEDIFLFLP